MPYCTSCGAPEQDGQLFCTICGTKVGGAVDPSALPYFPLDQVVEPVRTGLAGFWWRVLALLIDSLFVSIVIELPVKVMGFGYYEGVGTLAIAKFIYSTLFMAYQNGQTIGMKVTKVQVVNADRTLGIDLRTSVKRNGLFGLLVLIGGVAHFTTYSHPTLQQAQAATRHSLIALALEIPQLIDVLWPLWDDKNQALHDKFAGTVVIRPAQSAAQALPGAP
jgi:uncharacterized RDD family membrane protein YckC